ncbi:MAG: hypothetical protein QNK37_15865 [Acidobacteriota bacterium]|nr:hypothetical protein [Acidobacteriota bacterium]
MIQIVTKTNRLLAGAPLAFWGLLVLFALPIAFFRIVDVDIWWHMQLGRTFLETWAAPDFSTYYFTPVNDHIPDLRYTFLGDIIFYLVHTAAGDLGLQLMRLVFLAVAWYLVASLAPKPWDAGLLCLLFFFTAGCYQLLLIRNALFSLPLFCLLLWLWHQVRYKDRKQLIWVFPALLALWSTLHGTYLLGFGVLALIMFGDLLDNLKEPERPLPLVRYTAVLAVSFIAILFRNPLTQSTISRVWESSGGPIFVAVGALVVIAVLILSVTRGKDLVERFGGKLYLTAVVLLVAAFAVAAVRHVIPFFTENIAETESTLGKLKLALNNTYWSTLTSDLVSSEFESPFDNFGFIFVWSSLLLGLLVVVNLFGRRLCLSAVIPFTGILLLALGYQRVAGYLTIFSVFTLVRMNIERPLLPERLRQLSPVACAVGLAALYLGLLTPLPTGLFDSHVVGPGRMVTYSTPMAKRLREEKQRVFTTIPVGGFMLYHWFPDKRVYVDGFFAPHFGPAFDDYKKALEQRDPELLYLNHGAELAVIGLTDAAWIDLFARSEHWYPRYMDTGLLVFQRQPDFLAPVPQLELFLDLKAVVNLPKRYRPTAANRLFELGTAYLVKGRINEARAYVDANKELLGNIREIASGTTASELERNLEVVEKRYQGRNTKALFHEFHYNEAMVEGLRERLFHHGNQLLDLEPARLKTAVELADAALRWNMTGKAASYLNRIHGKRDQFPEFFEAYNGRLAGYWNQLADMQIAAEDDASGVHAKARATIYDARRYPQQLVLSQHLALYRSLEKDKQQDRALALLQELDAVYPDTGPVLQYLAMHYLRHQNDNDALDVALGYADRALPLQEAAEAADLDILYLVLKEIYKQRGDMAKATEYLEKARAAAPEDRKQLYRKL